MRNTTLAIAVALALFSTSIQADTYELSNASNASNEEYEPTEDYDVLNIGGFTVMVSQKAQYERPEEMDKALWILRSQIYSAAETIDTVFQLVGKPQDWYPLLDVVIWIDDSEAGIEDPPCGAACFFGSASYLERNNSNPDKEFAVGFTDIDWLLTSTWCCNNALIHELAHAWHFHVIPNGFDNRDIERSYERAKDSGKYDTVLSSAGRTVEAYSMRNDEEFFAEMTAAFYQRAGSWPFVYGELRYTDIDTFNTIADGWLYPRNIRSSRPSARYDEMDAKATLERSYDELLAQFRREH